MDKRYKHLNGEERGVILAEHRRGASLGAIGALLGRSASTIRNVSTTLRQWHLDFKLDFLRLALVG
jgi:IS30 family transposase